jgi:hypothetical protein
VTGKRQYTLILATNRYVQSTLTRRVNDQLHFVTVEEGGTKSVPHSVPFTDLDVQRTTDRNTAQGFRFVIRDKPIEQWLLHGVQ